jgi:hypothetical protein
MLRGPMNQAWFVSLAHALAPSVEQSSLFRSCTQKGVFSIASACPFEKHHAKDWDNATTSAISPLFLYGFTRHDGLEAFLLEPTELCLSAKVVARDQGVQIHVNSSSPYLSSRIAHQQRHALKSRRLGALS